MKNFDGTELKKARDKRDYINKLSRSELFNECKKLNIKVSREKNEVLINKLKKYYYSNLEDYEIKLLNKEMPLSDKEIDTYVSSYRVGKEIEVIYDKNDPERVQAKDGEKIFTLIFSA